MNGSGPRTNVSMRPSRDSVGWHTESGKFVTCTQCDCAPDVPRDRAKRSGRSLYFFVSFLMYAGLFGALFLMSQFFQTAQHHTPLQTGLRLLPWTGAPMIVAPIAGKLADRYGNRPFMAAGLFLQAAGLFLPIGLRRGLVHECVEHVVVRLATYFV